MAGSRVRVAAALAALALLVSVGGAIAASPTLQLGVAQSPTLGTYLTGPNGHTLYTLSSESRNGVLCTGGCLANWPPLTVSAGGTVMAPAGVLVRRSAAGVDETFVPFKRSDNGVTQVAQNGHPLYYFVKDTAAGQTNGEGIAAFGGVWHVAKALLASANPAPPNTSTEGRQGGSVTTPGLLLLWIAAAAFGLVLRWPLARGAGRAYVRRRPDRNREGAF